MELIVLWTIIRLVVPLSILRWPLAGVIVSMYLDFLDFGYLNIRTEADTSVYQNWDKIMDTYYLGLAFYKSLSWKEVLARNISVFSFLFRGFGVLLFLFTQSRSLLLFFPNFFENFFIFYLIFQKFAGGQRLFTSVVTTIIVVGSILLSKLGAEYYLHVLHTPKIFNLDRSRITEIFPASIEGIVLYALYLLPPIAVLVWRILAAKRSAKE